MSKKGISPLIATVLIIGFTIVLAVLVITWISGTVNDQTSSTDCQVNLQNKCLDSVGDISLSGAAGSNVILSNGGSVVFDGVAIVQDGPTGTVSSNIVGPIGAFGSDNTITIPATGVNNIKAIPILNGTGDCVGVSVQCQTVELAIS